MKQPNLLLSVRSILLFGSLVLYSLQWSCSKSDGNIRYSSIYHKTAIKVSSGIRLFSNQGELKDPTLLNRFIATDSSLFSYYSSGFMQSSDFMDSVQFTDALHAKLHHNYQWIRTDVTDFFPKFVLTRIDTTSNSAENNPYSQTVEYAICQYKPEIYQEWLISSTRGQYIFGYTSRDKYVFKFSGDKLSAQTTLYIYHQPYQYARFVNNFMDENFYLSIAAGDTISVQSYSLQYEK